MTREEKLAYLFELTLLAGGQDKFYSIVSCKDCPNKDSNGECHIDTPTDECVQRADEAVAFLSKQMNI